MKVLKVILAVILIVLFVPAVILALPAILISFLMRALYPKTKLPV